MLLHQVAECTTFVRTMRNDTGVRRMIADFPGFAEGSFVGKWFTQDFAELAAAPYHRTKKGSEAERHVHGRKTPYAAAAGSPCTDER